MNYIQKVLERSAEHAGVVIFSAILVAIALHLLFVRKRYIFGGAFLFVGLFSIGYLNGLLAWISGLGGDSFLEAGNFNYREACFWLKAFISAVSQMLLPMTNTSILIVMEMFLLSGLMFLLMRWSRSVEKIASLSLALFLLYFVYVGYAGFRSGRDYVISLQNQFENQPVGFDLSSNVDLFVYIGESTSRLNMSLYGYPLPTTPRLDKIYGEDDGLLRFDRVRSTHTHTSVSLLRALAVTSPGSDGGGHRWGIGQVLKSTGAKARLYSVQPLNGSFATFSRFVFEGVEYDLSQDDKYKGNYINPRFKDHELLSQALSRGGIVFFHSYAGHFGYLDLIDVSRSEIVARPAIGFKGFYGVNYSESIHSDLLRDSVDYDRAMTYVDRNVSNAIENIRGRKSPAVLIYFSDHGDAVYARRGHESSQYIDEMTSVPVLFYFNKAYREKFPALFEMYREASSSKKTRLLDQIAPSILEVLGVKSTHKLDVPTFASDEKHPRFYIMERDTLSGPSRIDLDYDDSIGLSRAKFFGGTPEPTYISMIDEVFGVGNNICYHRSNSYAKALRAASVASCIEFDLVVDGDNLNIYHPPSESTGLQIEHMFSIAQARKNSLWIDSKNLNDSKACNVLASFLEKNYQRVGGIFVEFPSEAVHNIPDIRSCAERMHKIGARTSFYVPTLFLLPCAQGGAGSDCANLNDYVQRAMTSGIFSDLSFDFLGYPAMKKIDGANRFKWNTWAIKAQDFHKFPRKDFDFVIMDTSTDPNTY